MNFIPKKQHIMSSGYPLLPYIWLNNGESEGTAACGCRLYHRDYYPAFDPCPLHAAAPELLALCHSLIESMLGDFHELSDAEKDLVTRLQPDSTAKDNPSRRTP